MAKTEAQVREQVIEFLDFAHQRRYFDVDKLTTSILRAFGPVDDISVLPVDMWNAFMMNARIGGRCWPPADEFGDELPECDQLGTTEYESGRWICDTHYAMVDVTTGRLCTPVNSGT